MRHPHSFMEHLNFVPASFQAWGIDPNFGKIAKIDILHWHQRSLYELQMVALRQQGLPHGTVAAEVGHSKTVLLNFSEDPDSREGKEKSNGGPKRISPASSRRIQLTVCQETGAHHESASAWGVWRTKNIFKDLINWPVELQVVLWHQRAAGSHQSQMMGGKHLHHLEQRSH